MRAGLFCQPGGLTCHFITSPSRFFAGGAMSL